MPGYHSIRIAGTASCHPSTRIALPPISTTTVAGLAVHGGAYQCLVRNGEFERRTIAARRESPLLSPRAVGTSPCGPLGGRQALWPWRRGRYQQSGCAVMYSPSSSNVQPTTTITASALRAISRFVQTCSVVGEDLRFRQRRTQPVERRDDRRRDDVARAPGRPGWRPRRAAQHGHAPQLAGRAAAGPAVPVVLQQHDRFRSRFVGERPVLR